MFDHEKLAGFIPELTVQRAVMVTSFFVIVYSGFTIAGNVTRSYQLTVQAQQIRKSIATDQMEYDRLSALKRYMESDGFIDTEAREEGLALPSDIGIVVSAPTPTATASPAPPGAWWERYFGP